MNHDDRRSLRDCIHARTDIIVTKSVARAEASLVDVIWVTANILILNLAEQCAPSGRQVSLRRTECAAELILEVAVLIRARVIGKGPLHSLLGLRITSSM